MTRCFSESLQGWYQIWIPSPSFQTAGSARCTIKDGPWACLASVKNHISPLGGQQLLLGRKRQGENKHDSMLFRVGPGLVPNMDTGSQLPDSRICAVHYQRRHIGVPGV